MTEKNNPHARRVTVSRVGEHKNSPAESTAAGRKVVAVRLKNNRQPLRATDVLSESAQISPPEDPVPQDSIISDEADTREDVLHTEEPASSGDADDASAENESAEISALEQPDVTTDSAEEPAVGGDADDTSAENKPAESPADSEDSPQEESEPTDDDAAAEESSCADADDGEACISKEISDPEEDPADSTDDPAAAAEATEEAEPAEAAEYESVCEPPADSAEAAEEKPEEEAPEADDDDEAYSAAESEDTPAAGKWYIPQQWRDITLPRKIIMILSAALFLFSCLPLFVGVISPGILPPAMIAAFFFLCALYWPLIDGCESTWGNVLIAVVAVCVLAGVTYLSFVSGKMISASANTLPENRSDVTVVVLGCKIHGDRPSRMLHARLEAAADFLLEHPQAHCIVTGGQGEDEDYPEAFVMKNYLVDKGISPMRIVMEPESTSTLENITFSAEMAEKYNCHERFLIVTDRFHQYRAMRTANDLGIVSYALNVETAWYLAMPYWFREMAAITRDWLAA